VIQEILRLVRKTGIDEEKFTGHYEDGSAQAALENDLALGRRLNIHSLPAFMVSYGEMAALVSSLFG